MKEGFLFLSGCFVGEEEEGRKKVEVKVRTIACALTVEVESDVKRVFMATICPASTISRELPISLLQPKTQAP